MASSEPPPFLLTPIDNFMGRVYNLIYLFFPDSGKADVSTVIDTLRGGLSKTLEAIPVLSGTVQVVDQREALCVAAPWSTIDDIFQVKDLRQEGGLEYRTIRDKHFPLQDLDGLAPLRVLFPDELFSGEAIAPPSGRKIKSEKPVVFVQVYIIKGGIILTLCLNHSFTDGNGTAAIAKVWGAYCRGEDGSRLVTPEMIDRERLMRGREGASLADFPEFVVLPTEDKAHSNGFRTWIYTTVFGYLTALLPRWPTSIKKSEGRVRPKIESAIFFFPKDKLAELKSMASARENGELGDKWISTIDALSALIGCCVASVRDKEIRSMPAKSWVLTTVISGRRLLDPPLPADYIGNILALGRTCAPNQSIDSTPAKVAEIAHLNRDQIKQCGDSYIQGMIGALSSVKNISKVRLAPSPPAEGLLVTSWANQGFYDINWGDVVGGGTERVRARPFDFKYLCRIMPEMKASRFTDRECGLEIMLTGFDKDEMARLKQNELFMRFAQWRCN